MEWKNPRHFGCRVVVRYRVLHLVLRISCVSEIVCAFVCGECVQGVGDGIGNGVVGAWRAVSQEGFKLGEDLLDWVEIGRVFGEKQETGAGGFDLFAHRFSFVRSQIVEHDDVVGLEGWTRNCCT